MKGVLGFLGAMALANVCVAGSEDREQAERIAEWERKAVYGAKYGPQVAAWAQYMLGISYLRGDGVPRDEAEAIWRLRSSAQKGYAPAQFLLAQLYQEGRGVKQDFDDALFWLRTAASLGHSGAQNRLSQMYANGIGVRKSPERAGYWAERAAEGGGTPIGLATADVAAGP